MIINRVQYLEKLKRYKDKDLIKVITGVRRSGKSVLLFNIFYKWLIKEGVKKERIIKINLENEEEKHLRDSASLFNEVRKRRKDKKSHYVFIDEIQYVEGFEDLVNSLKNSNCGV